MSSELREAVERLLYVIEIAGGPSKLSRAVELGQVSWFHKFNDAIAWVRIELDTPAELSAPLTRTERFTGPYSDAWVA